MTSKKKNTRVKPAKRKKAKVEVKWWKHPQIKWVLLALMVVTFITFLPSINNDFVNWDDQDYVTESPYVAKLNPDGVKTMFTEQIASNYHPLTILSLAINYKFSALNARGYHITNLILHLINTLLVFFFVYYFFNRKVEGATVAALLFAIHPMHVESVAWISERKDVLYTTFFMAGLITYLQYLKRDHIKYLVYTGIWFLLSLWSKPTAVMFPVILVLIDFYFKGFAFDKKMIVNKIPFFLLSIVFGFITIKIQSSSAIGGLDDYTIVQRIQFASYGVYHYLLHMFAPLKLATFHPYPVASQMPVIYSIAPVVVAVVLGLVAYSMKFTRIIAFGFLFFLAKIALTLQFVQVGSAIVSERYTYVSYIGLFMILAYGINYFFSKEGKQNGLRIPVFALTAIASLVFIFMSYQQCKVWKNSGELWTNVLQHYPNSSVAYNNRGNYYQDKNQLDASFEDLQKAIALNGNYYKAYISRGKLFRLQGKYQEALADYNKAIEMKPDVPEAFNNRGNIYFSLQQYDQALADYNKVLSVQPNNAKAHGNSGAIFVTKGDMERGLASLNKAIELDPGYIDAYRNRGVLYSRTNQAQPAVDNYSMVIRLDPKNYMTYWWRGLDYEKLGQNDAAMNDYNKALQLNPKFAQAYRSRSGLHQKLGNAAQAQSDAEQAAANGG